MVGGVEGVRTRVLAYYLQNLHLNVCCKHPKTKISRLASVLCLQMRIQKARPSSSFPFIPAPMHSLCPCFPSAAAVCIDTTYQRVALKSEGTYFAATAAE